MIIGNDAIVKGMWNIVSDYCTERFEIPKHYRRKSTFLYLYESSEMNVFVYFILFIWLIQVKVIYLGKTMCIRPDKEDFGRIFYGQDKMRSKCIAQDCSMLFFIHRWTTLSQGSIVMGGSCTGGGGGSIPAMSDESIIVPKQGSLFLCGAPLVVCF
jgi:hypothetical protein